MSGLNDYAELEESVKNIHFLKIDTEPEVKDDAKKENECKISYGCRGY